MKLAVKEMTIGEVIVSILVDVIIVSMLLWIIFTALGFAGEPIGDGPADLYHFLVRNLVGIVTTIPGICYFMYGLAIMLVLALDLSSMLQQKEKMGSSILEGHNTNIIECLVYEKSSGIMKEL
nr:hypothetical protein CFP56_40959 [Quercus suber]